MIWLRIYQYNKDLIEKENRLGPINYWLVLGHKAHDHKNSEAHLNLVFSSSNKYQLDLFTIIIISTNNTELPNA